MFKPIHAFLFCLLASLAASIARVYYLTNTVSAQTGFMESRMRPIGMTLIAFVGFCVLLAAVCGRLVDCRTETAARANNTVYPVLRGAVLLAVAVTLAIDLFRADAACVPVWQTLLLKLLGCGTAAVFLLFGVFTVSRRSIPASLWALPTAYFVMQVMVLFTCYANLALIAEHIFEMAQLCLLLLFFLEWGKYRNGLGGRHTPEWTACFGYGAAVLCTSSFVSRTLLIATQRSAFLHGEYPLAFSELCFAVLILLCLPAMRQPADADA